MRRILEKLSKGLISIEEAELSLKSLTISEVENMAKLDIKREISIASHELLARHRRTRRRKSWLGFRGTTSRRLRPTQL